MISEKNRSGRCHSSIPPPKGKPTWLATNITLIWLPPSSLFTPLPSPCQSLSGSTLYTPLRGARAGSSYRTAEEEGCDQRKVRP